MFICAGCQKVKQGSIVRMPIKVRLMVYPGKISRFRESRMPEGELGIRVRLMQQAYENPLGFETVCEGAFCGVCSSTHVAEIVNEDNPRHIFFEAKEEEYVQNRRPQKRPANFRPARFNN